MATNPVSYYTAEPKYSEDRERLILEHLPQVNWIAHRFFEKLGGIVSLDDLISTGTIGLINAVDTIDPSHNVKLRTYAEHKIRGAILDSVRGLDGIPVHKRKMLKHLETAVTKAENRLGRTATEEEVAAELNMSLAEYQNALVELRAVTLGSLDEVREGQSESHLLKYIPHDDESLPARIFERAELQKLLASAIEKMPKVERTILTLYFKEQQNLRDIAEILDIHITRVCQLKSQAILRLRAYMVQKWPATRGIY